jgi:hypothetical protein
MRRFLHEYGSISTSLGNAKKKMRKKETTAIAAALPVGNDD